MKYLIGFSLLSLSINFSNASEFKLQDVMGLHEGETPLAKRRCSIEIEPSPTNSKYLNVILYRENSKYNFNDEEYSTVFEQVEFSASKKVKLHQVKNGKYSMGSIYRDSVTIDFDDNGKPRKFNWSFHYTHISSYTNKPMHFRRNNIKCLFK